MVQVDLYTGMLVHALGPEGSVFAKQAEAWDVVESVFKGVRSRTDAMVLLGYIVVGNAAHVLLATAVRRRSCCCGLLFSFFKATATASLHGDHDIWTVSESAWMTVIEGLWRSCVLNTRITRLRLKNWHICLRWRSSG